MRLRILAPAFTVVMLTAPLAHAQDAQGFDAAATLRGFLSDAGLFRADSATVGSVTTEGDTVRASDVAMRWDFEVGTPDIPASFQVNVTIPTFEITSLTPSGGRWSAARIAVPEVTLEGGGSEGGQAVSYTVTTRDYVITNPTWAPLPTIAENSAAPVSRFAPLVDWTLSQTYDSATMGSAQSRMTTPDGTQEATYGSMAFGPVRDGVIATYSYGPISSRQTMQMPDPNPEAPFGATVSTEMRFDYGIVSGTNLDAKPFAQLLTGNGDATGPQNVAETMTLDGMTVSFGDTVNVEVGPTAIEGFTVDPTRGPLLTAMDSFMASALNNEEPNPEDAIGLALDVYGAIGVERYSLASIAATFVGGEVRMGELAIEELNAGGLGRFAIDQVDVRAEGQTVRLGSFEIADFVFPDRDVFMQLVMGSMAGMQPDPQAMMTAMPVLGRIAVADLSVVSPATGPLALDRFETNLENYIGGIPTRSRMTLAGLKLPTALITDPSAQMVLGALNLAEIAADGTLTLNWDEDSSRVELDNDLTVAGVGQLTATAALAGIPRYVIEDVTRAQEAMATASLIGFEANFRDEGVTSVLLDMVAAQSGVSRQDFVAGIAQQISMQVSMLTGDAALGEQISGALSTFLIDPRSLSVRATPANPVPVAQIAGAAMTAPQTLPTLLNFAIDANR